MIKEIVTDAEALSAPAQPATIDDVSVAIDLLDTMASLENAAPLAANQIGSDKAVIAYQDEPESPHDEAAPADAQLGRRKKRLEGWEAELVQHGIDHCKGKLV